MADEATQCDLAKEDISAYLDRELSGIDSARVEAHLRRCRECARERDLLKECRKLVGEIVEHRPSPALEALLIRRSQDYLDGFRAQRRRYRIALTARAWARRAILGALLVAVAAWGIYLIGRLWSARLAEV
ncbi:MAG: zf-HC2 domain-containing protein, partial [Candidatus Hydrogenedentes bacterium]|nr:zf-HC2 domain-containing protein [Candidatus Hydrogenedentota bacterium]